MLESREVNVYVQWLSVGRDQCPGTYPDFAAGCLDGDRRAYTPEYEVNTIAAVYPDNTLSPADSSSDRIDAAAAANGVLGSSAFREGLEELLGESEDRTFENFCVKNTNLVSITVRSSSAEDAYNSIRTLIDYYNEMAGRLTGSRRFRKSRQILPCFLTTGCCSHFLWDLPRVLFLSSCI